MNTESTDYKVQVEIILTKELLNDVFVTALEGGSNYWYMHIKSEFPKGLKPSSKFASEQIFECLDSGGTVYFSDVESDDPFEPTKKENIENAIKLCARDYPEIFGRIKDEEYDAGDADVFFQLVVLGDVIYG